MCEKTTHAKFQPTATRNKTVQWLPQVHLLALPIADIEELDILLCEFLETKHQPVLRYKLDRDLKRSIMLLSGASYDQEFEILFLTSLQKNYQSTPLFCCRVRGKAEMYLQLC
jgi:hypothetical protein